MADDDKGGQGGGGDKTYTQAELDAQIAGLKAKNTELIGTQTKLTEKLTALEKQFEGLDPARARKAVEDLAKAEAERQKAQGDWDAREKTLRDEFKTEHEKVVGPLQTKLTQVEAQLFEATAVRDALDAMADKEVGANAKLALPILKPELTRVEHNGKVVTCVKGEDGKPRYHPTTGEPFTPKDRLVELRAIKDYAPMFDGAPGSGSGGRGGDRRGGDGGRVVTKLSDFHSDAEKAQFIAEHGLEKFQELAFAGQNGDAGGSGAK